MPNAPVIFLIGPSTTGKTTICQEVLQQDQNADNLGFATWGNDQQYWAELESDMPAKDIFYYRDFLKDDPNFLAIEHSFANPRDVFQYVHYNEVLDQTGKILKLDNEAEFNEGVDEFLAETKGRYTKETLQKLQTLASTNPNNFREESNFAFRKLFRLFDHIIEKSQNNQPIIVDIIPFGDGGGIGYVDRFKEYASTKNCECPVNVALLHVPLKELSDRMTERNKRAVESGDHDDIRDTPGPFYQSATIFGPTPNGEGSLGRLKQIEVYQATERFDTKNGIKIRNMRDGNTTNSDDEAAHRSEMQAVFATIEEGKKLLNKFGFKDGETSIAIDSKVVPDSIHKHPEGSTSAIAELLYNWAKEKMAERKTPATSPSATFVETNLEISDNSRT